MPRFGLGGSSDEESDEENHQQFNFVFHPPLQPPPQQQQLVIALNNQAPVQLGSQVTPQLQQENDFALVPHLDQANHGYLAPEATRIHVSILETDAQNHPYQGTGTVDGGIDFIIYGDAQLAQAQGPVSAQDLRNGKYLYVIGRTPNAQGTLTLTLTDLQQPLVVLQNNPATIQMAAVQLTLDLHEGWADDQQNPNALSDDLKFNTGALVAVGERAIHVTVHTPNPPIGGTVVVSVRAPNGGTTANLQFFDQRQGGTLRQLPYRLQANAQQVATENFWLQGHQQASGALREIEIDVGLLRPTVGNIPNPGRALGDGVRLTVVEIQARFRHAYFYPTYDQALDATAVHRDDRNQNLQEAEFVIDVTPHALQGSDASIMITRPDQTSAVWDVPAQDVLVVAANGEVVLQTANTRPRLTVDNVVPQSAWTPFNSQGFSFQVSLFLADEVNADVLSVNVNGHAFAVARKRHHFLVDEIGSSDLGVEMERDTILHNINVDHGVDLASHRLTRSGWQQDLGASIANANDITRLGDMMRNTSSFFTYGHAVPAATGQQGAMTLTDTGIKFGRRYFYRAQLDNIPVNDLPQHLAFIASCGSAAYFNIARALIRNRAGFYFIGFAETVLQSEVRSFTSRFYCRWLDNNNHGDPANIRACFTQAKANYHLGGDPIILYHGISQQEQQFYQGQQQLATQGRGDLARALGYQGHT